MLSAEEILMDNLNAYQANHLEEITMFKEWVIQAMKIYRNQGIQQASEVCSEMLTDGFRISNVPVVLALKEEI